MTPKKTGGRRARATPRVRAQKQALLRMKIATKRLTPRLFRAARSAKIWAAYGGGSLLCPVCNHRLRRWVHHPIHRWELICPWCDSRPRHRMMWLWMRRETDLFSAKRRLLHLAPERGLRARLASAKNISYTSADIEPQSVDVAIDLCASPLRDASFDAIICSHVLEHIPDDRKAMKELVRMLRPGGWALLLVPLDLDRRTDEDPSATKEERLARFGQEDHVRSYGHDYLDRLRDAGFDVWCEPYAQMLGDAITAQLGLSPTEQFVVGRT